jgi:hypothetical protein
MPHFSVDMLICPLIIGHSGDAKILGRPRWTAWLSPQTLDARQQTLRHLKLPGQK